MLASCAAQQEASQAPLRPTPEWVLERPSSGLYYSGIGIAPKTPGTDYPRAAKEQALSDLVSEISVQVHANSLLHTLEGGGDFSQEYEQTIRTSSDLQLENFEQVDSWEDAHSYWVYYRLSKDAYQRARQQRKATAQDKALSFFEQARSALAEGRAGIAADASIRGLQSLEQFWAEDNTVSYGGDQLKLDMALYEVLRASIQDVAISLVEPVVLSFATNFSAQAQLLLTDRSLQGPLEGLPITLSYPGEYGPVTRRATSSADGLALVSISEIDRQHEALSMQVQVDAPTLFQPFLLDPFIFKLAANLKGAEQLLPLQYEAPKLWIDARESNLDQTLSEGPLSLAVAAALRRRNVALVENAAAADAILSIRASTRLARDTQQWTAANLEYQVELREAKSGQVIFRQDAREIRGVANSAAAAGMQAYSNATRNLESDFMRKLSKELF